MPAFNTPRGTTEYIPGVYSYLEVVSSLAGALPNWQVPCIAGSAPLGQPYNVQDSAQDIEGEQYGWFLAASTGAAGAQFGYGSELYKAFAQAKRHGLGAAFLVNLAALTRFTVTLEQGAAVAEIDLYPKLWGAPTNYYKITWDGTNWTTVPVGRFSMLEANASIGDTKVQVTDNSWMSPGQTVQLADNAGSGGTESLVVKRTYTQRVSGVVQQWVEFESALTAALATASYGLVCIHDEGAKETSPDLADGNELLSWLQDASLYFTAEAGSGFTGTAIDNQTETILRDASAWSAVTLATSPAATSTEHTDWIADLDASEWDRFVLQQQVVPQAFLVVSPSSTIHATWRDFAIAKRQEGYPISVVTGNDTGQAVLDAGDDTDPLFRLAALISQDVALCLGGMDGEPPYLSLAPAVFGRRIEGGPRHNLTNDELLYTDLAVQWDERGSKELTRIHQYGGITYRLNITTSGARFVISQGLNTLQNNANSWNEGTNDTPLIMQRDLADFVDWTLRADLRGEQLGADEVSPNTIGAVMERRVDSLVKRGVLDADNDFRIDSSTISDNGAGYDVDYSIRLPVTSDYIGLRGRILVGE